ncbi:glycosyl transferase family protein [Limnochorda pilosa]|uniref:Glycosyl transferase family protein n=1 Tax=Limnochorda pilosa TaxID=1555112 RepID=A0A0K2SIU3_LIMPI|nr:glycosyl transferase family protein [Limnochorda pilosa]
MLLLSPLGDTLFATPALEALDLAYPQASISVCCWQSNAALLRGNPHVDEIIACRNSLELPKAFHELQERSLDLAVGLSHFGSWLLALIRARFRAGFRSEELGWLYTVPIPDDRQVHAARYCLNVVRACGAPEVPLRLRLYLEPAERAEAVRLLARRGVAGRPLVAIHPGGHFFRGKRWSTRGFAEVADGLVDRYGAGVVLVGGEDDVELAGEIMRQARRPMVDLTGSLGLRQTAAVLQACQLFIGNDSGPMHMAEAVGTPVVALFGPTDPANFRPLGEMHRVVRRDVCGPCIHWLEAANLYLHSFRNPACNFECIRQITVDDVMAAAGPLLERTAAQSTVPAFEGP